MSRIQLDLTDEGLFRDWCGVTPSLRLIWLHLSWVSAQWPSLHPKRGPWMEFNINKGSGAMPTVQIWKLYFGWRLITAAALEMIKQNGSAKSREGVIVS